MQINEKKRRGRLEEHQGGVGRKGQSTHKTRDSTTFPEKIQERAN